jgi:hypothetical protein
MDPAKPLVGIATVVLPNWRRRSGGQVVEPMLSLPLFMLGRRDGSGRPDGMIAHGDRQA